jgi:hypothetical protein
MTQIEKIFLFSTFGYMPERDDQFRRGPSAARSAFQRNRCPRSSQHARANFFLIREVIGTKFGSNIIYSITRSVFI